ncbi:MAG TPA: hypothetical protein VN922_24600 [Bacteroidia bacterium]|nr:hypothetical protein [Bacteroidia bacterium]
MIDLKTDYEQLDKLSTLEVIALHDYFEKALKSGYYSAQCDINYCIAVKHRLRDIIMEYTALIFQES